MLLYLYIDRGSSGFGCSLVTRDPAQFKIGAKAHMMMSRRSWWAVRLVSGSSS